ncbi:MAG: ABC transporter substrate-binding protein [Nitrospirae bacterium]|nr:ABC transporter substrate-binding protein [Nitrospirota bacterium]
MYKNLCKYQALIVPEGRLNCRNKIAGIFRLAFLCVLFLILLWGCTRDTQPLRVGTNVWPGYEPLYLARELKYFDNNILLVEYSSASDVIRGFRYNAIDAAALTMDEALLLIKDGYDITVVLAMDISSGGDVILGRSGLNKLSDIKGKRVGVEKTALGSYFFAIALETVGLKPSDTIPVNMEVDRHETALKTGIVDAVVTFEPVRIKLIAAGANVLFDSSQVYGAIVDVLVVHNDYLRKTPNNVNTLNALLEGWFKSLDYVHSNPQNAYKIMAEREGISKDEFVTALKGLHIPDIKENRTMLCGIKPTLLLTTNQMKRFMIANDLLQKDFNVNSIFDKCQINALKR